MIAIDIRKIVTEVIENTDIDHIITQSNADQLVEELVEALERNADN